MDVRRIRAELRAGRSIYDLPLRVTFYARVSTDQDEQINSLENQVQYYTELIQSKPNWRFVPGYIDEGISGGTTKKRDDFNRMIRDAKAGMFDFIITKEISRFSRSTLDSIKYTQELLENNVGVLFQNDNINTLDTDSEFRLVIMAGVAQDEIRKLSERLKFGFRQAIKNGHVLGNDKLYGYDKKDCVLTINEKEAEIIRIIFDLYANQKLGTRSISKKLTEMGYTSREGNAFNTLTIRHILENPKYKGWYCGNKTSSLDYRTKKKAFLDESEWVMYPDPAIPAIVSEELWDRANALYKKRREETMSHSSGVSFQNRYPYSAKIICEEHNTTFHRQVLENKKGKQEVWQCKVYRSHGRSGCSAPQIRSCEVDAILTEIFKELMKDKQAIIDSLVKVITSVPKEVDYDRLRSRVQEEMDEIEKKKDRLLDLSIAGALDAPEFKKRNDALNVRLRECESQLSAIRQEEERAVDHKLNEAEIRRVLDKELSFEGELNSALLTTILDKIVVKKGSTKDEIHLDVFLKLGQQYEAIYSPQNLPTSINRLKITGQVTLKLMIMPEFHRRVAMVRQTGMKIKDKGNINGLIPFSGLLYIQGDSLNSYLRALENPQHLEWEVERAENKTATRKLLNNLTKFIKECLDELKDDDSEEALDPSVGEYLAADPENTTKEEDVAESISDSVKTIKVKKNPVSAKSTGTQSGSVGTTLIDDPNGDVIVTDVPGTGGRNGSETETSSNRGDGGGSGVGAGSGNEPVEKRKSLSGISPAKVRIMCTNKIAGQYTISFTPSANATNGIIDLFMSAESQNYDATILAVSCDTCKDLKIAKNRIEGFVFTEKTPVIIRVTLDYHDYCSMEVKAYGNKV